MHAAYEVHRICVEQWFLGIQNDFIPRIGMNDPSNNNELVWAQGHGAMQNALERDRALCDARRSYAD